MDLTQYLIPEGDIDDILAEEDIDNSGSDLAARNRQKLAAQKYQGVHRSEIKRKARMRREQEKRANPTPSSQPQSQAQKTVQ